MKQSIKHWPPPQQLCLIGWSQSRMEEIEEIVIARWNKVVGGVAHVLPIEWYYHDCTRNIQDVSTLIVSVSSLSLVTDVGAQSQP
jgi:hypothetical protein